MKSEDYKEKIEIAKKAIEGLNLDESLKVKAFEKVLDDLLNKDKPNNQAHIKKGKTGKTKPQSIPLKPVSNQSEQDISETLNADDFPEIHRLQRTLDKALYIIKIVRDKMDIDGLVPSQVAKILTERFRVKSNQFVISMALMKAKEYVDRRKIITRGGFAYSYRIMRAGENYLEKCLKEANTNIHENQEKSAEDS